MAKQVKPLILVEFNLTWINICLCEGW